MCVNLTTAIEMPKWILFTLLDYNTYKERETLFPPYESRSHIIFKYTFYTYYIHYLLTIKTTMPGVWMNIVVFVLSMFKHWINTNAHPSLTFSFIWSYSITFAFAFAVALLRQTVYYTSTSKDSVDRPVKAVFATGLYLYGKDHDHNKNHKKVAFQEVTSL